MRKITVLGSTGSVGVSTLDVLGQLGGRSAFEVTALTGGNNVDLLAQQARATGARMAVTANGARYQELKSALSGTGIAVAAGRAGILEAAEQDSDLVMAAIVGTAGLEPTLVAARRGADVALANKECLVSAGELFVKAVQQGGGRLLPVDSEHSAILQVLNEDHRDTLERIVITASGGPFRTWTREQMAGVTPTVARMHPTWSMGLKISIGSATMFNKALEVIEAKHLFQVTPEQVEVIVHPQSIIHSMVGYADGSVLAQLGCPDMRTAIGYALAYPKRARLNVERLDLVKLARLDFEPPDEVRFPALRLARLALRRGGQQSAIMNAAEETAFEAFVATRIGFLDMAEIAEAVMDDMQGWPHASCMEDVFICDGEARRRAAALIARIPSPTPRSA